MINRSQQLSTMLLAMLLSTAVVSHAQENELKSVKFGEEETLYSFQNKNNELIINAVGQDSASGLFVSQPEACLNENQLSWSWKVDLIQPTADITVKDKEDFAASLLIIFGKPGLFSKPKGLIYAFTNTDLPIGTVVNSPRAPENFRTIVLDNNQSLLMNWSRYERNIIADYKLAYGEVPDKSLHSIGVFTDNDQTKEPVKASYNLESCNLSAQKQLG